MRRAPPTMAIASSLRTAPKVLPYVLWGPFPWQAKGRREQAVIPETLAWYGLQALVILAIVGCAPRALARDGAAAGVRGRADAACSA